MSPETSCRPVAYPRSDSRDLQVRALFSLFWSLWLEASLVGIPAGLVLSPGLGQARTPRGPGRGGAEGGVHRLLQARSPPRFARCGPV